MRYEFNIPIGGHGSWKRESFISLDAAMAAAQAIANTYQITISIEHVSTIQIVRPEKATT